MICFDQNVKQEQTKSKKKIVEDTLFDCNMRY